MIPVAEQTAPGLRFRLRSIFLLLTAVVVATWLGARMVQTYSILDLTSNGPSACEIHRLPMSPKLVRLDYGMKRVSPPFDVVRPILFPHADEPYNTGWCLPPRERQARILVCPRCTKERAAWLNAQVMAN